jgi:hypothetical protein
MVSTKFNRSSFSRVEVDIGGQIDESGFSLHITCVNLQDITPRKLEIVLKYVGFNVIIIIIKVIV